MQFKYVYLALILTFYGCYEDIAPNYPPNPESKLIIEGILTDADSMAKVYVSQSVSMYNVHDKTEVNNAHITVSDNLGNVWPLTQIADGEYSAKTGPLFFGTPYTLTVTHSGMVYTATEVLRPITIIDSMYMVYYSEMPYYANGYYLQFAINVPQGYDGFYRLVLSRNDTLLNQYTDLLIFETMYYQGPAIVDIPVRFNKGDKILATIYSLPEPVYDYYVAYQRLTQGYFSSSSVPVQNPPTNISGNVLGYFQVSSVQTKTLVVE
jgi:hypothetical protein